MTSQEDGTDEEYADDPITLIDYEQKRINELQRKPNDRKTEDLPQNVHLVKKCRPCSIKLIDFEKHSWYCKKNNKYIKRKTIACDAQNLDLQNIDTPKLDTQNIVDCIIISDSENEDGDMSLGARKVKPKIRPVDISSYVRNDGINVKVQNPFQQASETSKVCIIKEKDTSLNMPIDFKKNQGLIGLKIMKMDKVGKTTVRKVCKDKAKGKTSKRELLSKHGASGDVKVMTDNCKIFESENIDKNVTVPENILNTSNNQNSSVNYVSNKKSKNNKNSNNENQETKSSEISDEGNLSLRNDMQKSNKTFSSEPTKTDLKPEKKNNAIVKVKQCDIKYIKDVWDKELRLAALGTGLKQKLNLNRKEQKSLENFKEKLKNEKPKNIKENTKCTSNPVKIDKVDNANKNTAELKKTTKVRETSSNKHGEIVLKKLERKKTNERTINSTKIDKQPYQSVIDKDEQMAKSIKASKQLNSSVIYEEKAVTQLPLCVEELLNPGVIYKEKPLTLLTSAVNKQIKTGVSTSNSTVAPKIIDKNCSQGSIQKQNEDENVTHEIIRDREMRMPAKFAFYVNPCLKTKYNDRKDTVSMVDNPTGFATSDIAPQDSQEILNEQINIALQPPEQIMQNNSENDQNKMLYNSYSDRSDNFIQGVPLIRALETNMNNTTSIKIKDSLDTSANSKKEDPIEIKNTTPSNAPIPNNQLPNERRINQDDSLASYPKDTISNQQMEPYIQLITKHGNLPPVDRICMKPKSTECLLNANVIVNNSETTFNPDQRTPCQGENNQVYKHPKLANRNHQHNVGFPPHANIKNSENLHNIPRGVIRCTPIYNGPPQNMLYSNQNNRFWLNRPPTQSHKSHPQRQLFHPPHRMPHPLRMSHPSPRMSVPQVSNPLPQMSYPPQIMQSQMLYSQQQMTNPTPQMSNPTLQRSLPQQLILNSPQMYPQQQISNPALQNSQPQNQMSYPSHQMANLPPHQMANLPPHMSNPVLWKTPEQQQASHSPQMYPLQQMAQMSNFAQQKSQLQPQVTNQQQHISSSSPKMQSQLQMSNPSQTSNHALHISQSLSPMSHLQQQISNSSPKALNPQSGMSYPPPQMLHIQTHMSNPPPQPLRNKLSMKHDQVLPRSVTGSTIIGINDGGVVRKINITAAHTPATSNEMLEELSKVTTLESFSKEDIKSPLDGTLKRPLPKDDLTDSKPTHHTPATSKEMLEELSKVTTLESFSKEDLKSPLDGTLKRPLPKDDLTNSKPTHHTPATSNEMLEELSKVTTLESFSKEDLKSTLDGTLKRPLPKDDLTNSKPTQKPGPLSKKKQFLKSNSGYSPPILPIETFEQTYQHFAKANIEMFDKRNLGPNIELGETIMTTNALRKKRWLRSDEKQDKSATKISIAEYKKRSTKMDENGMEIDKNLTGQNTEQDLGYDSDSTMK